MVSLKVPLPDNVQIDWRVHPMFFKFIIARMKQKEFPDFVKNMSPGDKVQCLSEALEWLTE